MSLTKERLMENVCSRDMKRSQARSAIEALLKSSLFPHFPAHGRDLYRGAVTRTNPVFSEPESRLTLFQKKYTG
jgi:hypothetical protein